MCYPVSWVNEFLYWKAVNWAVLVAIKKTILVIGYNASNPVTSENSSRNMKNIVNDKFISWYNPALFQLFGKIELNN